MTGQPLSLIPIHQLVLPFCFLCLLCLKQAMLQNNLTEIHSNLFFFELFSKVLPSCIASIVELFASVRLLAV